MTLGPNDTLLITGGAGFIGSHLAEHLVRAGVSVVLFDNFDPFYDPRLKQHNVALVREAAASTGAAVELVTGDLRDVNAVNGLFTDRRYAAVVHLAALAGVRPSIERPAEYVAVNLNGTALLLEAMRESGHKRLVFASSSSVYGNNEKIPFAEADPVDHPISPYAATKKAGELLCHTYHALFGFDITCLRFFTVYGPRQRPEMAIHRFARLILDGQPIPMFGDGTTVRDYTYVADIVDGVIGALDHLGGYRIYNLGGGNPISLMGLIQSLAEQAGVPAQIDRRPMQPGDVERTISDTDRARAEIDYAPRWSLADGLKATVASLRDAAVPVEPVRGG